MRLDGIHSVVKRVKRTQTQKCIIGTKCQLTRKWELLFQVPLEEHPVEEQYNVNIILEKLQQDRDTKKKPDKQDGR